MFVSCPSCRQSLPAGSARCQFCGAALAGGGGPRSAMLDDDTNRFGGTYGPGWIGPAYVIACLYFIIVGLIRLVLAFAAHKNAGGAAPIAIGGPAVEIAMGFGLLARIDFVRSVTKWLCGLSILCGGLGILGAGAMATSGLGAVALIAVLLVDIALNALMIYLINETD